MNRARLASHLTLAIDTLAARGAAPADLMAWRGGVDFFTPTERFIDVPDGIMVAFYPVPALEAR